MRVETATEVIMLTYYLTIKCYVKCFINEIYRPYKKIFFRMQGNVARDERQRRQPVFARTSTSTSHSRSSSAYKFIQRFRSSLVINIQKKTPIVIFCIQIVYAFKCSINIVEFQNRLMFTKYKLS